ncbi:hypothetical protein MMPV_003666 [Pyropia vietnamensis]
MAAADGGVAATVAGTSADGGDGSDGHGDGGRGGGVGVAGWLGPALGVAVAVAVGVAAVAYRRSNDAPVALPHSAEEEGDGEESGPFRPPVPPPGASFSIGNDPEQV